MGALLDTPLAGDLTLREILSVQWLISIVGDVIAAALILIAALVIAAWVRRRIIGFAARRPRVDVTLFTFLGNIARYAIIAFGIVLVLGRFGVQTASIVAVIGAAGLAIGLALQGTLTNFAAGVMLIVFRPFNVGQFIEAAGKTGTVKDISIFTTEIATLDNVQVILPNSQVWGNVISNFSAYERRRVEWVFSVAYGSDLKVAEEAIRGAVLNDFRALHDPAPWLQVTALSDFSVDFTLRVWCRTPDVWDFKNDSIRAVKRAFDAAGIEIPFPTRTVIAPPSQPGGGQPDAAAQAGAA